jgi:hypothetical protein
MNVRAALPFASLTAATLLGLAAPAQAQEATAPVLGAGMFPGMGPDGNGSQLEASFAILDPEGGSGTLKRIDISGQFMSPNGTGAYARIAGSFAEGDSHLGSLELGGLWRRSSESGDVTLRAGLVAPTSRASDSGDDDLHLISTFIARPSDLLTAAPETTTLRVAASPSLRSGNFVARADVGLDVVVHTSEGDLPDAPYLHVDLGAGFDNGKGSLTLEMSNMVYLDETDSMLHVASITGAFHAGQATPYLSIGRPFGDLFSDEGFLPDFTIITFGARGHL